MPSNARECSIMVDITPGKTACLAVLLLAIADWLGPGSRIIS
jgi:hypothetical protein